MNGLDKKNKPRIILNQSLNLNIISILLIFLGGIIVGFILGGIASYYWNKYDKKPETKQVVNNTAGHYAVANSKHSQDGSIIKIADDKIILKGWLIKDGQRNDQEYTVFINQDTKYKKFNLLESATESVDISLTDLKEGDNITALISDDIKDKTEFTANQINLYIEEE